MAATGDGPLAGGGDHLLAQVHPDYPAAGHYQLLKIEGVGPRTATSIEHSLSWPQAEAGEAGPSLVSEHFGLAGQKGHVLARGRMPRVQRSLTHFDIP